MSIGPWVFNGVDIVVLLVVFISLIMAASRGLFRELISISALLGAMFGSLFIWGRFRFAAQDFIKPAWLADAALAAGSFILIYLLIVFLLSGVTKGLRGKNIGFIDRVAGAGFGAARGLIVCALAVMVATASYRDDLENHKDTHQEEILRDYLRENPGALPDDIIPDSIKNGRTTKAPELPGPLKNSTLFPILDKIGDGIRALPIGHFKSAANRIKAGEDLKKIAEEL